MLLISFHTSHHLHQNSSNVSEMVITEELESPLMSTEQVDSTRSSREGSILEEEDESRMYHRLFNQCFYSTKDHQNTSKPKNSNYSSSLSSLEQTNSEDEREHH